MATPVDTPAPTPILRALFGRLFDSAGMYPPAQAPMEAALALHDAAERAPWGFARGRFLCPGAVLDGLAVETAALGLDRKALRVGAVVGSPADVNATSPLDAVVAAVAHLRDRAPAVHVDLLEVRPSTQEPDELAAEVAAIAAAAAAADVDNAFVEVAVAGQDDDAIAERIAAVAEAGASTPVRLGTKVRCGGLEPGMVPTGWQLATFLHASRRAHLPFKATAGLHHATGADDLSHHGFVSLLLASVMAQVHDLDVEPTARILTVQPGSFDVDREEVEVRAMGVDDLVADVEEVTSARYAGFVAFGTCSFTEPAREATALFGDPS